MSGRLKGAAGGARRSLARAVARGGDADLAPGEEALLLEVAGATDAAEAAALVERRVMEEPGVRVRCRAHAEVARALRRGLTAQVLDNASPVRRGAGPGCLSLLVDVHGVGLSVVDHTPCELVYAVATGLSLTMVHSPFRTALTAAVDDAHVDNQLPGVHTDCVVLSRAAPDGSAASVQAASQAARLLQLHVDVDRRTPPRTLLVRDAELLLQPLELVVHESLVRRALEAVDALAEEDAVGGEEEEGERKEEDAEDGEGAEEGAAIPSLLGDSSALVAVPLVEEAEAEAARRRVGPKVVVRNLRLRAAQVVLTFIPTPALERPGDEGEGTGKDRAVRGLAPAFTASVRALGAGLSNLQRTPLSFSELRLRHVSGSAVELRNLLLRKLYWQLAQQAFRVVLSAPVLGNPVGLVTGVGSSVKEMIVRPGRELAGGRVAAAGGQLLGSGRGVVRTVGGGLMSSISGVAGGLQSLASRTAAVPGVGLLSAPVAGALGTVSGATGTLAGRITGQRAADVRVRPPRVLGAGGEITRFDAERAHGQLALSVLLGAGAQSRSLVCEAHALHQWFSVARIQPAPPVQGPELALGYCLFLTPSSLVCVGFKRGAVMWSLPVRSVRRADIGRGVLAVATNKHLVTVGGGTRTQLQRVHDGLNRLVADLAAFADDETPAEGGADEE